VQTEPLSLRSFAEGVAAQYHLRNIPHFLKTIECESHWRTDVYGDNGMAYGPAQFWKTTFEEFTVRAIKKGHKFEHFDYYNEYHQIELMAWAYANGLDWHWTCSEKVADTPPPMVIAKAKSLVGTYAGECVAFIKAVFGREDFGGIARDIQPNATEPEPGEIVLLNESELGHVALVTEVGEDTITLCESNYEQRGLVSCGRTLDKKSPTIRGYYKLTPTNV
jgi:hypothetical protein